MTDIAATVLTTIETAQLALGVVQSLLALTAYQYPAACTPENNSYTDYIVVGVGSAGSVLASRLSEESGVSVLGIEAGGVPPEEASLPGGFTVLPLSQYDYNFTAKNDGYSAQNLLGNSVGVTQGKGLGGSGFLNHMIHVPGSKYDFVEWTQSIGEDSWSYENVLAYMKIQERLVDAGILNSSYASYHGTDGPKMIQREMTSTNLNYLEAFQEMGHEMKMDISDGNVMGCNEPLLNIAEKERKSNAVAYLGLAKNRSNLCVATSFTVKRIIVVDGTAKGVEAVDSSGNTYILYANREVIVSAGAINTPKLLLLSGIGNATELEALGISVVADVPEVGKNLQDHLSAPLMYQMQVSTETTPAADPHAFPVPMTTLYAALNSSQDHPDYQTIVLEFPHDSTAFVQLCSNVFKYSNAICNKFYKASNGRKTLFVVHNLMKPKSRGSVTLQSTDYTLDPIINLGLLSNSDDLTLMSQCLEDFNQVLNTTYFKSVNASLVSPGMCSCSDNFWECYTISMSNTMWHYSGTCAMGTVLDSNLKVKGISNLRVIDASSMPTVPTGNIEAVITMVAEKGAALIKAAWA